MNKISAFFWFLAICVLLSACDDQGKYPSTIPSNTPTPKSAATVVKIKTMASSSLTPSPTQTSTATPTPSYSTKQVLLDYTVGGFHTPYDLYYADYGDSWSKLVLYTDGQLIIPGKTFQQKILTLDDINLFLSQLETKGLFSLTQDSLYDFGDQNPPRIYDGTIYCVIVSGNREQKLCAYKPYESFLVPEVKNILQFLNDYHPEGMTPYNPDRILLWVRVGRMENSPEKAILWNENFPTLETSDEKIVYAEGDVAKEIFSLFGNKISTIVISQNNVEYTVSIDIVLPHEQLQFQP